MRTFAEWMEWAEARASRNEDGCLVWKMACREGVPQAGLQDDDGKKITVNVRRVLWAAKVGRPPRKSHVIVCKCDTEKCIEPSCLKEISRSQLHAGKKKSAAHRIAITKAARNKRNIKLTEEAMRDIRDGDEHPRLAAEKHGVTISHVYAIRAHRWCRELHNPFAGLM